LEHARAIIGAKDAIAVWEAEEEPFTYLVRWQDNKCEERKLPLGSIKRFVAPELEGAIFVAEGSRVVSASPGLPCHPLGIIIDPQIADLRNLRRIVTAPFLGAIGRGRVFLTDPEAPLDDVLDVAAILAIRIAAELEHHQLGRELAQVTAAQERVRLGRDVHDGVLQHLTAAGLRLTASMNEQTGPLKDELAAIAALIAEQQLRLRALVSDRPASTSWPVRARCQELLHRLGQEWRVETSLQVVPADLQLPSRSGEQVAFLMGEAVANAVRHGKATKIEVEFKAAGGRFSLKIANNGQGTLQASSSLRERALALGGRARLHDTESHVLLEVEAPLA
jgi:signal transduction histidine kinase